MNKQGIVLQLQNFSLNDGDGIRTTIFLMGCPLRCLWCSNPETWTKEIKFANYEKNKVCCLSCNYQSNDLSISSCPLCKSEVKTVKENESKELGQLMSVDEIVSRIKRQEIFYRFSNGGVTFSGGEPTVQLEFVYEIAEQLFDLGIHMSMETCGYFDFEECKKLLSLLDHIFVDIKCVDDAKHIKYTGVSNKNILKNIVKLKELGLPITIRIPLIEEINTDLNNINSTISFIKENFNNYPINVELLKYHNLGNEKYDALSLGDYKHEFTTPSKEKVQAISQLFIDNGIEIIEYK